MGMKNKKFGNKSLHNSKFSKKWYRAISLECLVDEMTVRNCFLGNHRSSLITILRLCEWRNLNVNDFYK